MSELFDVTFADEQVARIQKALPELWTSLLSQNEVNGSFICSANPWLQYVFGNWTKEWFKQKIQELDINGLYYRKTGEKEEVPERVKNAARRLYEADYHDELEALAAYKKQLERLHPHAFRQQPSLPSSFPITDMFNHNIKLEECIDKFLEEYAETSAPETSEKLQLYVQGYKAAGALLKSIPNSSLDVYCTEKKTMVNTEHKKEIDALMEQHRISLNLPTASEYVDSLNLRTLKMSTYRLSLDRQPPTEEGWSAIQKLFDSCF